MRIKVKKASKKKSYYNLKKGNIMVDKMIKDIMSRPHISKSKLGQITVKKVGSKYAACISGTPEELFNSAIKAYKIVNELRRMYGRRTYNYSKNAKSY